MPSCNCVCALWSFFLGPSSPSAFTVQSLLYLLARIKFLNRHSLHNTYVMKFNFTTLKPCKSFVMRRFAASPWRFDNIYTHTWTVFESCSPWWKSFFKRARFSCLLEWLALLKEQHLYHVWWITISLTLSIRLTLAQSLLLYLSHQPIHNVSRSVSVTLIYQRFLFFNILLIYSLPRPLSVILWVFNSSSFSVSYSAHMSNAWLIFRYTFSCSVGLWVIKRPKILSSKSD